MGAPPLTELVTQTIKQKGRQSSYRQIIGKQNEKKHVKNGFDVAFT
jgi:hypothetical protein